MTDLFNDDLGWAGYGRRDYWDMFQDVILTQKVPFWKKFITE